VLVRVEKISPVKVLDASYGEDWVLYHGDSAEALLGLPDHSIGHVITSLPFSNVYSYTASDRDLGNTLNPLQFFRQFGFMTRQLLRAMIPGRVVAIHCKNLPLYGTRDGVTGRWDFRGMIIRHMQRRGFIYHSEVTIDKDPRIPAKAYHPQHLLYVTLDKDSSKSGPCEADYICFFRVPGENPIPIKNDVSHPEWVDFAHPVWQGRDVCWNDISEVEVLDPARGITDEDNRHLCPLQLEPIRRCIRLWSNPGETVLDLFNGVGSVGTMALELGRKYVGLELNPNYYKASLLNLEEAERKTKQITLLDLMERAG
jgi:DNA modification methylase